MAGALCSSGSIGGSQTAAATDYLTATVPLDFTAEKCASFPTFKRASTAELQHSSLQEDAIPGFPQFHRCCLVF